MRSVDILFGTRKLGVTHSLPNFLDRCCPYRASVSGNATSTRMSTLALGSPGLLWGWVAQNGDNSKGTKHYKCHKRELLGIMLCGRWMKHVCSSIQAIGKRGISLARFKGIYRSGGLGLHVRILFKNIGLTPEWQFHSVESHTSTFHSGAVYHGYW